MNFDVDITNAIRVDAFVEEVSVNKQALVLLDLFDDIDILFIWGKDRKI